LLQIESLYGVQVAAPRPDAASPTGYSLGRRNLIEPGNSADTYHLVMQTQAMLASGSWRLHHVDYDNAPGGREMHWASPPRWWLALLACLDHGVSGRSLGAAAEQAALYANPLLLAILLLCIIPRVARRFGPVGASLMAVGMVASHPFYLNFIAGNAEHQGVAAVCALMTVVCLLGGAGGWIGGNSALPAAVDAGVDTLVTGELREEHFNRAQEERLNLFLCGHYATEVHAVKALAAELSEKFGLPWVFIATENPL
jgi:hypothetical protein